MHRPGISEEAKELAESRVAECFDGNPRSFEEVVRELVAYVDDLEEELRRRDNPHLQSGQPQSALERELVQQAIERVDAREPARGLESDVGHSTDVDGFGWDTHEWEDERSGRGSHTEMPGR